MAYFFLIFCKTFRNDLLRVDCFTCWQAWAQAGIHWATQGMKWFQKKMLKWSVCNNTKAWFFISSRGNQVSSWRWRSGLFKETVPCRSRGKSSEEGSEEGKRPGNDRQWPVPYGTTEEVSLNRDAEGFASFMSVSRGKAAGMGVGHWQGEGEERRHHLSSLLCNRWGKTVQARRDRCLQMEQSWAIKFSKTLNCLCKAVEKSQVKCNNFSCQTGRGIYTGGAGGTVNHRLWGSFC